jgi:uncharacterized protein YqeY
MNLETQVMAQMKDAMKSKNEAALRSLRAIKAALIIAKTSEGANGEVSPDEEMKILQKMVKQRKDSLEIFQQQGRADLALKEQEELDVILVFLPAQLDGDTLLEAIKAVISEVGATSPADMGKVMGIATKKLAGKADGKAISAAVKQLLA